MTSALTPLAGSGKPAALPSKSGSSSAMAFSQTPGADSYNPSKRSAGPSQNFFPFDGGLTTCCAVACGLPLLAIAAGCAALGWIFSGKK